jgi:hypothetical protein
MVETVGSCTEVEKKQISDEISIKGQYEAIADLSNTCFRCA